MNNKFPPVGLYFDKNPFRKQLLLYQRLQFTIEDHDIDFSKIILETYEITYLSMYSSILIMSVFEFTITRNNYIFL